MLVKYIGSLTTITAAITESIAVNRENRFILVASGRLAPKEL